MLQDTSSINSPKIDSARKRPFPSLVTAAGSTRHNQRDPATGYKMPSVNAESRADTIKRELILEMSQYYRHWCDDLRYLSLASVRQAHRAFLTGRPRLLCNFAQPPRVNRGAKHRRTAENVDKEGYNLRSLRRPRRSVRLAAKLGFKFGSSCKPHRSRLRRKRLPNN